MLKTIVISIFALVGISSTFMFFLLTVDIIDGRNQHLDISPYFTADTTVSALALALVLMIAGFMMTCLSIYGLWEETRPRNPGKSTRIPPELKLDYESDYDQMYKDC